MEFVVALNIGLTMDKVKIVNNATLVVGVVLILQNMDALSVQSLILESNTVILAYVWMDISKKLIFHKDPATSAITVVRLVLWIGDNA